MIRYNRRPSEAFKNLFNGAGLLHGLISELGVRADYRNIPFDVFFRAGSNREGGKREGDEFSIYCGKTAVATVRYLGAGNRIKVDAEQTYRDQKAIVDPLMDPAWDPNGDQRKDFQRALKEYLTKVIVESRWWDNEGVLQTFYTKHHGKDWNARLPWAIFDREAVPGYSDDPEQKAILQGLAPLKEKALKVFRRLPWAKIPERSSNKLDMIGVSADGLALVLIEAKHSDSGDPYYSGLQLLDYVLEWENALRSKDSEQIIRDINGLIDDQKELGLLPHGVPRLIDKPALLPVWVVGGSRRSAEVEARCHEVIDIINRETAGKLKNLKIERWVI